MKQVTWIVAVLAGMVMLAPAQGQEAYKDKPGEYIVEHKDEVWKDAARNREVPVRIYLPTVKDEGGDKGKNAGARPGKLPVIIYSHGLGGSRNVGAYLADHLATHGFIVISPTHAGSDTEAVRKQAGERVRDRLRPGRKGREKDEGFLKEATSDPDNLKNRPKDISFIIDELSKDDRLWMMADVNHIGVMGHSFGAYTGFAIAGMTIDLPEEAGGKGQSFRDPRVKAVVAMSPQGAGAMGITKSSWQKVSVPVLSLTGTKDYGQGERAAAWRREGFDSTKGVEAMLVVIRDATHGTFSDNAGARLRGEEVSQDHGTHIRYVKMVSTAYFDGYVLGNKSALNWIRSGELKKFDQGACEVEVKGAE